MALRTKEAALLMLLAGGVLESGQLRFQVRHEHLRKGCEGVLSVSADGIAFAGKSHAWRWSFSSIQQLKVEPQRLTLLTYEDRKWLLGVDRDFKFTVPAGASFEGAYPLLKDHLGQRLVAALGSPPEAVFWKLPAKKLRRITGAHGTLVVGADRLVFESSQPGVSRTWLYPDLDNISSSGPFELTVTAYERSRTAYGSLKSFHFQLKQPLTEDRYNELWWLVNQDRIRRVQ